MSCDFLVNLISRECRTVDAAAERKQTWIFAMTRAKPFTAVRADEHKVRDQGSFTASISAFPTIVVILPMLHPPLLKHSRIIVIVNNMIAN